MSYRLCLVVGVLLAVSLGVDGLYCFKCLNIDCIPDDPDCQTTRTLITNELKPLYYFKDYMDACPQLNETYNWRLMQATDEACGAEKAGEATCTLGYIQVKIRKTDKDEKTTVHVHHATVMGCATRTLLRRISTAFEQIGKCDLIAKNVSDVGVVREIQIEHCRDIAKQCHKNDYCLDYRKSEIKIWPDENNFLKRYNLSIKLAIFALVVIIIFTLLIAGMLREPAPRPSNCPRTIGDESETAKVLQITHKNSLTSIEVADSQHNNYSNGNAGTIGRRPKLPPPPPPRQHRPLVRESTPV